MEIAVEFDSRLVVFELETTVFTDVDVVLMTVELEFATVLLDDVAELVVSKSAEEVVVAVLFASSRGVGLVSRALIIELGPALSARDVGETSETKAISIRAVANGFKRRTGLESDIVDSSVMLFLCCD